MLACITGKVLFRNITAYLKTLKRFLTCENLTELGTINFAAGVEV
jgi:hypothetical protein